MLYARERSVASKKEQRGHGGLMIPFTIDGICIARIWHEIYCNDH